MTLLLLLQLLVKRELLESGLEFFFPTFVGDCDSIFEVVVKSGDIERVEEFEMEEFEQDDADVDIVDVVDDAVEGIEGIERTPFKSIEELIKVDGCGELKFDMKMKWKVEGVKLIYLFI